MKRTPTPTNWLTAAALAAGLAATACAHEPPRAASAPEPGLIDKAEQAAHRGVSATASGIERGAQATERGVEAAARGVERGAKAAVRGVKKGAHATADAVETAARKIGLDPTPPTTPPPDR